MRNFSVRYPAIACAFALVGLAVLGDGFPPPPEEPITVAVLPLGLSQQARELYPQLAERQVGFGIHNILVEHLHASGWFRLVEEKQGVIDDLLNRQWVASSGAVSADSAVRFGHLQGAQYVLYGEVYDFGVHRTQRKRWETSIAIQIRLVEVESSIFIPATGRI